MKKIFYLMFAATIGTAMVACDDDNDSVEVSGISLDKETVDLTVGDTLQLTATVTPENADNKTVVWTSDNTDVVTVDVEKGVVTAVAAGEAVVTAATANGKTATCKVTVKPATVEVSGISLDKKTVDLTVGDTLQLTATVTPENADDKTVTWTSDKPEVVTVNDEGMVTALAAGEAVVTAAAGGKTDTCKVTVMYPPVNPEALIKTIRIPGDTEGFYNLLTLTYTDKKITTIKNDSYTSEGEIQGTKEVNITYNTDKVTITGDVESEFGEIEFTLNEKGYVKDALYGVIKYEYGNNGMLEKISAVEEDEDENPVSSVDIFKATYDDNKNLATILIDPETGEESGCTASAVLNNKGIDLNLLIFLYGSIGEIDYAILCGLIPSTPNLLESDTEGDITFVPEVNKDGQITSFEMKGEDEEGEHSIKYYFGY